VAAEIVATAAVARVTRHNCGHVCFDLQRALPTNSGPFSEVALGLEGGVPSGHMMQH